MTDILALRNIQATARLIRLIGEHKYAKNPHIKKYKLKNTKCSTIITSKMLKFVNPRPPSEKKEENMAKYEMPVIEIPKEDVKVNVNMAQDADSVSFILVVPFEF